MVVLLGVLFLLSLILAAIVTIPFIAHSIIKNRNHSPFIK